MFATAWLSVSTWCSARFRNSASRQILEARMPRHGEVRAIELQHEAGAGDRLVFLAHRRGRPLPL